MKRTDTLGSFGRRVRSLRSDLGMSQEDLAAKCALDRTYVGGIERGERNPSLKNISKLAISLGVSLSQLMEGVDA
jgi:transcriptional regulator with XRE-family HTH domain